MITPAGITLSGVARLNVQVMLTGTIATASHKEERHRVGTVAHAIGDTRGTLEATWVSKMVAGYDDEVACHPKPAGKILETTT